MRPPTEQFAVRVMSGDARGAGPSLLRAAMLFGEAPYRAATWARNRMFDAGLRRSHRLPRPVISVGNITTGGTGKTPMVIWLARQFVARGRRPGVLIRGYRGDARAAGAAGSDEAALLDESLNHTAGAAAVRVPIQVGADRVASGSELIGVHPELDALVLDDGFQHRRLARDFDLVLIDATNPFGHGHVLPRGLLRESLPGLRRAHAFVITRFDQADRASIERTVDTLCHHNFDALTFRARHVLTTLLDEQNRPQPTDDLRGRRVFAFCGIGNPQSFQRQLLGHGAVDAGSRWFADHHTYSAAAVSDLRAAARAAQAELLVTTEKDWTKLRQLPEATSGDHPAIWRAQMEIEFVADDGRRLIQQILNRLWPPRV